MLLKYFISLLGGFLVLSVQSGAIQPAQGGKPLFINFAAAGVWDAGTAVEVGVDYIAPVLRMGKLNLEFRGDARKRIVIDMPFQRIPLVDKNFNFFDALKMCVIDMLD